MTGRFEDGYKNAVNRINEFSDQALYPYLKIGIFGPYSGDCHSYLTELKFSMHDAKFEKTEIASDFTTVDEVPDDYEGHDEEFWFKKV